MTNYLITGVTGFLGRNVVPRLLARDPSAQIDALVRPGSVDRLSDLVVDWPGGDRVRPLVGDLEEPGLGLDADPDVDVVVHLGAIYDMTVGEEQASTNVEGTRAVVELTRRLGVTLHHVSSIAVAGDHTGPFDETDFDLGQGFPSPYHRTKFEAERLVREARDLRWRIYRPAVVVGDSRTGEINKIDGPYYLFPALAALARLPHALPVLVPDLGSTNIVPVDYVADALVELLLAPGLDGRTFHLTNPTPQPLSEIYAALADAAGAPRLLATVPAGPLSALLTVDLPGRDAVLRRLGVPPGLASAATIPTVFGTAATQRALSPAGIRPPQFREYAPVLWQYWRDHLDPDRARRGDPHGPLVNRHVVITGASSGIGRAAAFAVAERGARVILIARRADELAEVAAQIRAEGGTAFTYPCDLTEEEAVEHTVKTILADHGHVDMLVNNAGRSIRRSVYRSTDRLHDFERTMAVNYFGAVRLTLALLPQMRERRFGHIVNVSTAGVQVATAALRRLRREQGRARQVRRGRGHRDVGRRDRVHHHPPAARGHRHDHAVR